MREGEYVFVEARAVLLATGGGPTTYRYHMPSADESCDDFAMALRAGLPLRDTEMRGRFWRARRRARSEIPRFRA
jgi:fumarate reductase flavoprotein subunit